MYRYYYVKDYLGLESADLPSALRDLKQSDIHQGAITAINNKLDIRPVTGSGTAFAQASRHKKPTGKWVLHCQNDEVDGLWQKVLEAVRAGHLLQAKVTGIDETGKHPRVIVIPTLGDPSHINNTQAFLLKGLGISEGYLSHYKGDSCTGSDALSLDMQEFRTFRARLAQQFQADQNRFFGSLRTSPMLKQINDGHVMNMSQVRVIAAKKSGQRWPTRSQKLLNAMAAPLHDGSQPGARSTVAVASHASPVALRLVTGGLYGSAVIGACLGLAAGLALIFLASLAGAVSHGLALPWVVLAIKQGLVLCATSLGMMGLGLWGFTGVSFATGCLLLGGSLFALKHCHAAEDAAQHSFEHRAPRLAPL